ncbi:MAG: hypothetical protein AUH85_01515 [Chloroflexi bacterium 13_1_40CM_4_68_4]|nr:MAG: hypothetical protein AUH85_01515 [Chloroflexi bacterium 13_1_40CM_4_68_4]
MRRLALTLALVTVVVIVVTAGLYALGRAAGVGPFAPGVPTSWIFTAISRSGEDGDAREIEVIDLATGERQLFSVDDRAFDIALSRDRRTLYVGTTNGRVFELDALHGTFLGEIKLGSGGEVRRIVILPDGQRILAVATGATDATASLIDLGVRREKARLQLGNRLIGKSIAGKDVVLSSSDRQSIEQLLTLDLDPLRVKAEVILSSLGPPLGPRTAAPSLELASDGSIVALSPFALRLSLLSASTDRRNADVPFPAGRPPLLVPGFDGDLVLTRGDGIIQFCVGTGARAERYVTSLETLQVVRVGAECGRYARLGDGTIYLAVRAKPELRELDPVSGQLRRTLALAGFPQRVAY